MKRNWYKFKIKYAKILDSGKKKNVSVEYLVDAMSFTETEARAIETANEEISTRDFDIVAISRESVSEIIRSEDDAENPWFKANVTIVAIDDTTGESKESPQTIYVQATDTREADKVLREHMKGSMFEWDIKSITKTKVVAALDYQRK